MFINHLSLILDMAWTILYIYIYIFNRTLFSDQEQLDMLIEHHRLSPSYAMGTKLVVLAPDAINSDPPAMTRQTPSSRVLHLMGEDDRYREVAFKRAYLEICRNSKVTLINSEYQDDSRRRRKGVSANVEVAIKIKSVHPLTCGGSLSWDDSDEQLQLRLHNAIEKMSHLIYNSEDTVKVNHLSEPDLSVEMDALIQPSFCTSTDIKGLISELENGSGSGSSSRDDVNRSRHVSLEVDWSAIPHQLSLSQSR